MEKWSKKLAFSRNRPNERTKAWGEYLKLKISNKKLDFEKYCKKLIQNRNE